MADSRKIVVGVDGSRAGVVAALWAASVADKVGCPIRIVHVLPEDLYRVSAEMVIKQGAVIARKRDAARAIVDDAVAAVGQRHPNISSSGTIVAGPTSTALARVGRDAQMIVLGHPRGLDGPHVRCGCGEARPGSPRTTRAPSFSESMPTGRANRPS